MPIVKKSKPKNAGQVAKQPKVIDKRTAMLNGYRSTIKKLEGIRDLPRWLVGKLHQDAKEWLAEEGAEATFDQIVAQQQSLEERLLDLYSSKMSSEYARKEEDAEYQRQDKQQAEEGKRMDDKMKEEDGMVTDTRKYGYEKRMEMAQSEKDKGAQTFKEQDYKGAAKHWTCSKNHLLFLEMRTMNEAQAAEVLKMTALLELNVALACIKGLVWGHCVECCDKVIQLKDLKSGPWRLSQSDLAKAYYRKGLALSQGFQEWDLALEVLNQAQQTNPVENRTEETAITNQIARVKKAKTREYNALKKRHQQMGQYMLSGFDDSLFKLKEHGEDTQTLPRPKPARAEAAWEHETDQYAAYEKAREKEHRELYGSFKESWQTDRPEPIKLIRLNAAFAALGEDDGDY